jgi:hypothetical protein
MRSHADRRPDTARVRTQVHAAGLACRCIDASKILLTRKSRLRVSCVGMLDLIKPMQAWLPAPNPLRRIAKLPPLTHL